MKELKRTSSIHLFDDLQLIEIVEHKKTVMSIFFFDSLDCRLQSIALSQITCFQ